MRIMNSETFEQFVLIYYTQNYKIEFGYITDFLSVECSFNILVCFCIDDDNSLL